VFTSIRKESHFKLVLMDLLIEKLGLEWIKDLVASDRIIQDPE